MATWPRVAPASPPDVICQVIRNVDERTHMDRILRLFEKLIVLTLLGLMMLGSVDATGALALGAIHLL